MGGIRGSTKLSSSSCLLAGRSPTNVDGVVDQLAEIERDRFQLELAGFDFREVEDVADQVQQRLAGRLGDLGELSLFVVELVCSNREHMPITPLSGVRSSCDMLARNWLLAWLADSAATLAASSSCGARFELGRLRFQAALGSQQLGVRFAECTDSARCSFSSFSSIACRGLASDRGQIRLFGDRLRHLQDFDGVERLLQDVRLPEPPR